MNLELLEADVRAHFTPERRGALLKAVREAYDRAVVRYCPDDGDDAQLFGFTIYKFIAKRLIALCRDPVVGFELCDAHPLIRVGVGPFTLAAYCCGTSGDQPISESFPLNENGAPQLVDLNQFCLELDDKRPVPRALVLAHLGNPYNGLEALYLAFPAGRQGNRIGAWSHTELLWRRRAGDEGGDPGPDAPRPDLPRPVVIEPVPLSLKLPTERTQASDK